jgi:hypothetical protein
MSFAGDASPLGRLDTRARARIALAMAAEDARHTLVNYWWEGAGWVRPDWPTIVEAVLVAADDELGLASDLQQ